MPQRRPTLCSLIPGCRGASREQSREHRGFRSCRVTDDFGAPAVATRDQLRPLGKAGPIDAEAPMSAATPVGILFVCRKTQLRYRAFHISTVSTTAGGVGGVALLQTRGNINIRRLI
jgi:hypothetical protein